MSDPNLPEGVTQKDIDSSGGGGWPSGLIPKNAEYGKPKQSKHRLDPDYFNPDLCQHDLVRCENCDLSIDNSELKIKTMKARLDNIRVLCSYLEGFHPPVCGGWNTFRYKIIFERSKCNCFISDIVHEVEMAEDFI